jgi:hypothetical protein
MVETAMPQLKFRRKRGVVILSVPAVPLADGVVREVLTALSQAGCRNAVLDLGGIAPDPSLAKPLLSLRRRLSKRRSRLVLCGLSTETMDWLRSTWLLGLFEVRTDVDSAVGSLSR